MNPNGKQVKNDHFSSMVMSFLKKRNFSNGENSSVKSVQHVLGVEDVALKNSVNIESGVPNVLSFSVNNLDPNSYDEQYGSLKSFITGANPAYRQELIQILFPVFANSYLDLIAKGFLVNAQSFLSKYSSDLGVEFKEDIQNLQAITDSERLKSSDTAANFRRSKYCINLSHKVFTYFMQYLRSSDHMLLLQLINRNFSIEITQTKPGQRPGYNGTKEESDDVPNAKTNKDSKHHKSVVEKDAASLTTLKESIDKVRNGPACLPSVCFYTFQNAYQGVSSAGISNDGGLLCGGFEDSSIHLWSLTPKKLVKPKTVTDISKVILAPDALPNDNSRVETVSVEELPLLGHSGPVYTTCFSPDMSVLLSASEDATVRLWSLHSYNNVVLYKGHNYPVWSLDISSQSSYFVTGSHDTTARLWNIEYNYPLRIFSGHLQDVDSVKFHPNCNYLATGSTDKTCRLWDVQAGSCVRLFRGHKGSVLSLAISPDGKYLVSSGEDRRIRVWDLSAGNTLKELRGHTDTVYSLCFSADGTLLASGGLDNHVRVWDFSQVSKTTNNSNSNSNSTVQSSELLASYSTRNASVNCVKFSSCNMVLAAGAASVN